jgi:hypothetical protein
MSNEVSGLTTRGDLATHIAAFIQDLSSGRRAMILRDLDYGYRQALERYDWPQLLRWADSDLVVSNGQAFFFTPKDVRTIIGLIDATTPFVTQEMTAWGIVAQSGGFTQISGVPTGFAEVGEFGIKTVLDAGTSLEVFSSAADTRTGWLRGRLDGEQKTKAIQLNGTNIVPLGAWDEVYEFSLATSSTTLAVTLRNDTTLAEVALIAPNESQAVYRRYRLFTLPSGTRAYRIAYKYTPPQIFSETHTYQIPVSNYLIEWGIAKSYESRRQYDLAQKHTQLAEAAISKSWYEITGNRVETAVPLAALSRITQGSGIVINAYGYR